MFFIEINDQDVIDARVQLFFDTIDNIISKENHPYKYPGTKKVLILLNEISVKLGLTIRFFKEGEHIGFQSQYIGVEVLYLKKVEEKFRKEYRRSW